MPVYRLYRIGKGNHFVGAPTLISCNTDDEAVAKARGLGEPHRLRSYARWRHTLRQYR